MLGRFLSYSLMLIGLGLLGLAGWQFFLSLDRPGAALNVAELHVSGLVPAMPTVAAIEIRNDSRHTVRVLGLATC